jgi:hypothetical protein
MQSHGAAAGSADDSSPETVAPDGKRRDHDRRRSEADDSCLRATDGRFRLPRRLRRCPRDETGPEHVERFPALDRHEVGKAELHEHVERLEVFCTRFHAWIVARPHCQDVAGT